jgi:hypothetical protein
MRKASPEEEQPKKSRRTDEDEEVAVVATANAIVEPDAVVVLSQLSQTLQWWARGGRQMLQLLQYLVGTSIAALVPVADTTMVHSVVAGPRLSGSSLGLRGGKGCRFRGSI